MGTPSGLPPTTKSVVQHLADANRNLLLSALDAACGPKVIVWDSSLTKRFDLVATSEQMKQHKVVSMLVMGSGPLISAAEHDHVIYILPSTTTAVKKLIAHLSRACPRDDRRLHHALFVPNYSYVLRERLFEQKEVKALLSTVASLPLRTFPLYDDFFVLFAPDVAAKLLIHNDWTELQQCASALRQFESLSSVVPNLRCKGKWSAQIAEMIKKMRAQGEEGTFSGCDLKISDIMIIDRWTDPLTPMLTQLTYGGLVDEVFQILPSGGIKTTVLSEEGENSEAKEKQLNDELFFLLRDLHIGDVPAAISKEYRVVAEVRENLRKSMSESITQMKVFVRKLTELQGVERSVLKHNKLATFLSDKIRDDSRFKKFAKFERSVMRGEFGERPIPFIEDLMMEAYRPDAILRLIAIQTLCCGGLKPATYNSYLRLFVQNFGAYEVGLWIKLQLMGLIFEKQSNIKCDYASFDFTLVNKRLGCLADEEKRQGTGYPYSGYLPPLVGYVESGVTSDWRDWTSVSSPDRPPVEPDSTSVVFVVGGITMAEAASLRRIQFPNRLIIISTALTNGSKVFKSVCDI